MGSVVLINIRHALRLQLSYPESHYFVVLVGRSVRSKETESLKTVSLATAQHFNCWTTL